MMGRAEWSKAGPVDRGGFTEGCFDILGTPLAEEASRECSGGCTPLTEETSRECCGVAVSTAAGPVTGIVGAEALLRAPRGIDGDTSPAAELTSAVGGRATEAMVPSRNGAVGCKCEGGLGMAAVSKPINCQVSSAG